MVHVCKTCWIFFLNDQTMYDRIQKYCSLTLMDPITVTEYSVYRLFWMDQWMETTKTQHFNNETKSLSRSYCKENNFLELFWRMDSWVSFTHDGDFVEGSGNGFGAVTVWESRLQQFSAGASGHDGHCLLYLLVLLQDSHPNRERKNCNLSPFQHTQGPT